MAPHHASQLRKDIDVTKVDEDRILGSDSKYLQFGRNASHAAIYLPLVEDALESLPLLNNIPIFYVFILLMQSLVLLRHFSKLYLVTRISLIHRSEVRSSYRMYLKSILKTSSKCLCLNLSLKQS